MPKYSYYDYVKNYDARFLNKYQSGTHWFSGRGSNFHELLRLKAIRMKSNRNWMWFDVRFGAKFIQGLYLPLFFFVTISALLAPAWRKLDERYQLRFNEGDYEEMDDNEQFVTFDQRKKPLTRRKYADTVKLVYSGREEYDMAPEAPMRYR